jgi:hypothetical protein
MAGGRVERGSSRVAKLPCNLLHTSSKACD